MLFYDDGATYFDVVGLRDAAAATVASSSLIRRAAGTDSGGRGGQVNAARALHIGFWPFVREFELAIDRRRLPRSPLTRKFDSHHGSNRVSQIFKGLREAVAEMRKEEGSHAAHWIKDASCLGVESLEGPLLPGVTKLIDAAYVDSLPQFFAVLAGTEFIAEELSSYLTEKKAFTDLFSRKRWVWGDVHLIPHDHGPSHLEIDLDLARAYSPDETSTRAALHEAVLAVIRGFGQAANEVDRELAGVR